MFKEYKETIIFLVKFVVVYVLLSSAYDYYLNTFDNLPYQSSDSITAEVAVESAHLAEYLGFSSEVIQNNNEPSVRFILDDIERIKIVEGCNGASVMIIFVTFIIAFGGKFIYTLLFIPAGILIIHLFNVFRITLLAYIYVYYNDYAHFAHDYVFQPFIYGVVFILWILWVNYFSSINSKRG